tara:strand:- start:1480 stop:1932 length:453 start_codon:yes stop_codon:yes gene_type:complete
MILKKTIVAIASGGGHLSELQNVIPEGEKSEITYITDKSGHTKGSLREVKHLFIVNPHISSFKYFINACQAILFFVKLRPTVIISTGAGIAIPFMLVGYLLGAKIIYIESGSSISALSKTGEFMYKYSDLFIVHYAHLLQKYPDAKIASL